MKTVTEGKALRQAKEIFRNTPAQVDDHLIEECIELAEAVKNGDINCILDETGDVLYMIAQKLNINGLDIMQVLKRAIIKNEKKRKNGGNTI